MCIVNGCQRTDLHARGYCNGHYQRWLKGTPMDAPWPQRYDSDICAADGCTGRRHARGYCFKHYWRIRTYGSTELPERPPRDPARFVTPHGYVMVSDSAHPNANSSGNVFEHRMVMAEHLGRPLLPGESVHHINGDRTDNRVENLELWTKAQPAGQRVEDKVAWAVELLNRYRPDLLAPDAAA